MKSQVNMYMIVVGVFLLLISGSFLSEGISSAGLDNAVVSQRMALGNEDFWLPTLQVSATPDRMNYLPLGYWLESRWFRLIGSHSFMAEKIYSVLNYLIIAVLVVWIWCMAGNTRRTGWMPLLCLVAIPLVTKSATNNLLESTMTIFVLLAVAFLMKGRNLSFKAVARKAAGKRAGRYRLGRASWTVLAALMMELAFMVKGVMGLFPVFFPMLYWTCMRRENVGKPIMATLLILVTWSATLFVVISISKNVYLHLYDYLHHQLIGGVLHVRTVSSRFYILYSLLLQMIIPVAMIALLALLRMRRRSVFKYLAFWRWKNTLTADEFRNSQMSLFFALFGLVGVLPIMIGFKQQSFYLVPVLPFFALSAGCMIHNLTSDLLETPSRVSETVASVLSVVTVTIGILLNVGSIHKVNSHQTLFGDMSRILPILGWGETVSVSTEVNEYPDMAKYFYRYKEIVFDTALTHRYMITMYSTNVTNSGDTDYVPVALGTTQFKLYEKITSANETDTIGD